jgi:hypothetical protein
MSCDQCFDFYFFGGDILFKMFFSKMLTQNNFLGDLTGSSAEKEAQVVTPPFVAPRLIVPPHPARGHSVIV